MVIINKDKICDLTFEELHIGTVFRSGEKYCIKTDRVYKDDNNETIVVDAINLMTGEHEYFEGDETIDWIASKLMLE